MLRRLPAEFTPHGAALIVLLLAALVCLGTGCAPRASAAEPAAAVAAQPPSGTGGGAAVAAAAGIAQRDLAQAVVPAVVAVREAVQNALPQPAARGAGVEPVSSPVSPAAVALIVRHEIIGPTYYARALQGFACPGDRSGPTAGIGSDLGVQTRATIRAVWSIHPQVERMTTASRQIGFAACKAWRADHRDIRTPLPIAQQVFAGKLLPRYYRMAAHAFRKSWHLLPPDAQGGLTATVYVRGAGMEDAPGSQQRKEMRVMRDTCGADVHCLAAQHRAMCPRFAGRKDQAGLCKRFNDTADLIERSAA
jgi:hypothetical protein